jgi:hypothetical protein
MYSWKRPGHSQFGGARVVAKPSRLPVPSHDHLHTHRPHHYRSTNILQSARATFILEVLQRRQPDNVLSGHDGLSTAPQLLGRLDRTTQTLIKASLHHTSDDGNQMFLASRVTFCDQTAALSGCEAEA